MPEDTTRVTYDKNGGKVTKIPSGTPKEETEKARRAGKKDINDPGYNVEDARADVKKNNKTMEKRNRMLADNGE